MSRSIHRTRRDASIPWSKAHNEHHPYATKRKVKAATRAYRTGRPRRRTVLVWTHVPITVEAPRAGVVHPMTADEVRSFLGMVPGMGDGLTEIVLELGAPWQRPTPGTDDAPDPIAGRLGFERFPGMYEPLSLGLYEIDHARVRLAALVIAPDAPFRAVGETILTMQSLVTLGHELGHHHDFQRRIARGRWTGEGVERSERYAREVERRFIRDVVVPWMTEHREAGLRAVEDFIRTYGGTALAWEDLAVIDYETVPGEPVRLLAPKAAVADLVCDVVDEKPAWERKMRFAEDLLWIGLYDAAWEALQSAESEAEGSNAQTALLRGEILLAEGRYERAFAQFVDVLGRDPDAPRALWLLGDTLYRAEQYAGAAWVFEEIVRRAESPTSPALIGAYGRLATCAVALGAVCEGEACLTQLKAIAGVSAKKAATRVADLLVRHKRGGG